MFQKYNSKVTFLPNFLSATFLMQKGRNIGTRPVIEKERNILRTCNQSLIIDKS